MAERACGLRGDALEAAVSVMVPSTRSSAPKCSSTSPTTPPPWPSSPGCSRPRGRSRSACPATARRSSTGRCRTATTACRVATCGSTAAGSSSSGSATPAWSRSPRIMRTRCTARTGGCGAWSGPRTTSIPPCVPITGCWSGTSPPRSPVTRVPDRMLNPLLGKEPGRLPQARPPVSRPRRHLDQSLRIGPAGDRRDGRVDSRRPAARRHDPVVRRAATAIRGTTSRRPWPCRSAAHATTPSVPTSGCGRRSVPTAPGTPTTWRTARSRTRRLDTNVCAYVATGVWHHFLVTGDSGFLEDLWPVIERAIDFVLAWQRPGGELLWSHRRRRDAGGLRTADRLLLGLLQPALRHRLRRAARSRAPRLGARRRPPPSRHRLPGGRLRVQGRVRHGLVLPRSRRRHRPRDGARTASTNDGPSS